LGSPGGKSKKTDHNMPRYFEYIKNQTEECRTTMIMSCCGHNRNVL